MKKSQIRSHNVVKCNKRNKERENIRNSILSWLCPAYFTLLSNQFASSTILFDFSLQVT